MRSGSQMAFKFIPKVLDRVEVRAPCRPVKFFHTKAFLFMDLAHKISLYVVALRFPFGTMGQTINIDVD